MSQPRDDRQDDLFRPALVGIINLGHPLVRLAAEIDWGFLAGRFGSVCRAGPGQPPLPTRLVAGLFILKHMHNLSDEMLCDRWVENPYLLLRRSGVPPRGAVRSLVVNALATACRAVTVSRYKVVTGQRLNDAHREIKTPSSLLVAERHGQAIRSKRKGPLRGAFYSRMGKNEAK